MADKSDCSPILSVKSFKEQFIKVLKPEDFGRKCSDASEDQMAEEMDVSVETFRELAEVCW